jgi:hypothetical protein
MNFRRSGSTRISAWSLWISAMIVDCGNRYTLVSPTAITIFYLLFHGSWRVFASLCRGCMLWVYVVGVCCGCMLWVYVVGVCCGCMLWVYVVGVCCGCMLWVYVVGVCCGCMFVGVCAGCKFVGVNVLV